MPQHCWGQYCGDKVAVTNLHLPQQVLFLSCWQQSCAAMLGTNLVSNNFCCTTKFPTFSWHFNAHNVPKTVVQQSWGKIMCVWKRGLRMIIDSFIEKKLPTWIMFHCLVSKTLPKHFHLLINLIHSWFFKNYIQYTSQIKVGWHLMANTIYCTPTVWQNLLFIFNFSLYSFFTFTSNIFLFLEIIS